LIAQAEDYARSLPRAVRRKNIASLASAAQVTAAFKQAKATSRLPHISSCVENASYLAG
jgi:hypothetical protein